MIDHKVTAGSGRTLSVREEGIPRGHPVFALHGTPGSRLLYPPIVADAERKGIRLISYDRPGYGGSTPHPGRTVGDAARDIATIADQLGIDRFGVWGHSGGGAPALACAALLGTRVVGAVSVAGVAPYPAEGLDDWLAGTGEWNVEDFRLMLNDRSAWEKKNAHDCEEMLGWNRDQLRAGFASLCSEVDRRAMTDELVDFFLRQMREGVAPGDAGMRDDGLSTILPWGFTPSQIRVPVQVWHGDQDRFVPVSHGRWIAERIPNVEAHIEPEQGHLTVYVGRIPLAQSWLAAKF